MATAVSPDGNRWQVYDREFEREAALRREAWRTELRLGLRLRSGLAAGLVAGYLWDQHWQFPLQGAGHQDRHAEDSPFFGLYLGWRP